MNTEDSSVPPAVDENMIHGPKTSDQSGLEVKETPAKETMDTTTKAVMETTEKPRPEKSTFRPKPDVFYSIMDIEDQKIK